NAVSTAAQPGAGAGASILARASGPQVTCPRPIPIVPRLARGHRTRLSHLRLSGSITALATPFTLAGELDLDAWRRLLLAQLSGGTDRKSTRLNSSHVQISYAVFCLKKQNTRRIL